MEDHKKNVQIQVDKLLENEIATHNSMFCEWQTIYLEYQATCSRDLRTRASQGCKKSLIWNHKCKVLTRFNFFTATVHALHLMLVFY